jgi:membrane protein
VANFLLGFVLISMIFASIYKLLPDIDLEWGDVAVGAAALYELGQLLIGVYLHTAGASAYSAAGGLIRGVAVDLLFCAGVSARR